ncbi:Holo-[acyl-carrier protein] synthase [Chitinispirillum alkaliphilum]|nr:Holo-[acyl-carrier protein] synthase [Chitinispirillum alkaliphilum]
MIRGIGTDIVEIDRIGKLIEKYANHFIEKVYTSKEILWCSKKAVPAVHYAGRWAVKEAFYKALPDTCQPFSSWKSIEILPGSKNGRPAIRVVDQKLTEMLESEQIENIHLSISHEKKQCVAVVILE